MKYVTADLQQMHEWWCMIDVELSGYAAKTSTGRKQDSSKRKGASVTAKYFFKRLLHPFCLLSNILL